MTLTEQQKQALREKTASAKVQSKLPKYDSQEPTIGTPEEAYELSQAQAAADDALEYVSRETLLDEKQPYTRADEQRDLATADYYDQVAREQASSPVATVDDIPWDGNTALAVSTIDVPVFVEGFRTHGLSIEQIEDAAENLQTYLNVKVRHVSEFIGRELKVIGSANVPLEGNVTDRNTGKVAWMKWVQPRWKLAAKDEMTGQHVVLHGGGTEALRLVRLFTALYGPGDWKQPKKVTFTMETRDNGHILYHISHWRITNG